MESKDEGQIQESLNAIEVDQEAEQPVEQVEGLSIAEEPEEATKPNHSRRHKLGKFLKSGWGKTLVVLILIIGVSLAIPMTRYAFLGFLIKKQTVITVVDETTGKPVSDATVHFARADGVTDKQGVVTIDNMSVGDHPLSVEKKYYETANTSYTVRIFSGAAATVKLKATGRLAAVTVKNAISGKVIAGASVKIGDTSAVTDDSGVANIALAIRDADQPGTVSLDGYNQAAISVSTKDVSPTLDVSLVPSGKLYFLSNRNGTYDIMSSTLDGSNQEVVLKGTGREAPYDLQLIASPTGDTLAFASRRSGKLALYAVNTATKEATVITSSGTSYNLIGWADDVFYYTVYTDMNPVVAGRMKLMSYNQSTKKTTEIDSTQISSDGHSEFELSFSQITLTGGRLYYARSWQSTSYAAATLAQKASLVTVANGKVTVLKSIDQTKSMYSITYVKKPNLLYFNLAGSYNGEGSQYFRYQVGGSVESVQLSDADFMSVVTYMLSPNGTHNAWTETRDGKPVNFVGDANGSNERQIGSNEYRVYGWLGNDYILFSKNSNELYIMSADGQGDMHKITDYYTSMGIVN